jgi:hypothetical protein
MKRILFPLLIALSLAGVGRAAYTPPTEGELDQLLANPKLINLTIKDANGEEAAEVMLRIIERLDNAGLSDVQVNYLVAFYTARISFLLPATESKVFATTLANSAAAPLVPTILAGLSIGAGGIQGFDSFLQDLAGEDPIRLQAIQNPRIPLTTPVYNLLVSALSGSQTLPPTVTDSLPPPEPTGADAGLDSIVATPVIPDTYDGQG